MRATIRHLGLGAVFLACGTPHFVHAAPTASASVAPGSAPSVLPCAVPVQQATVNWSNGELVVDYTMPLTFSSAQKKKLDSGQRIDIATRIYVFPEPVSAPTTVSVGLCSIIYDLWNEVYMVKVEGPGAVSKTKPVVTFKGVLRACDTAKSAAVTDVVLLGAKPSMIAVLVDIEPSPAIYQDVVLRLKKSPRYAAVSKGSPAYGSFSDLFCKAPHPGLRFQLPGRYP